MRATIKSLLERAIRAADEKTIMSPAERAETLKDLRSAIDEQPKWWIVLLKVLAYAIGLLLAGYGTTACALSALAYM